MPTTTRFDLGGGGLPGMPSFSGAGKKLLQIAVVVLVIILLMASTTSIPTGNVGVLTLFGRVTNETLPEGIHLVNPLKSVQKMSVQTQSVKVPPVSMAMRRGWGWRGMEAKKGRVTSSRRCSDGMPGG